MAIVHLAINDGQCKYLSLMRLGHFSDTAWVCPAAYKSEDVAEKLLQQCIYLYLLCIYIALQPSWHCVFYEHLEALVSIRLLWTGADPEDLLDLEAPPPVTPLRACLQQV
jgi:hypothetical protein